MTPHAKRRKCIIFGDLTVTIVQVGIIKGRYSMKADSKIFKGIEYVLVSELPQAQRDFLAQTVNPELYIKLLIEGKIVAGCLQYKDYARWYHDQYQAKVNSVREQSIVPGIDIQPNLALNQI